MPPAILLRAVDGSGDWDSQLEADTSVQQITTEERLRLQSQYEEHCKGLQSKDQRILFKQFFALQNRVNTSMLNSVVHGYASVNSDYCTPNATKKRAKKTDIAEEIMKIQEDALGLQSPLPQLDPGCEYRSVLQDVKL